jgi:two-component system chemotaxis response regulator CheB
MNAPRKRLEELMPGRDFDVLVIGGSAGAFTALRSLLPTLTSAHLIAIVVIHQPPTGGDLAPLYTGVSALPCITVEDKELAQPGTVYFAPAGYHLLVEKEGHFALSVDAPVNYSRPSIDVLFESAAEVYGPRVAALVLTGASDDGARGMKTIAARGGITLVQDPAEAEVALMPASAVRMAQPLGVLKLAQIGELFSAWSREADAHA